MLPPIARQPGWVQAVVACKSHGLALLVNGTVVQWGNRTAAGRVPDAALSNVVSMSCNDDSSFAYKVQCLCICSCQLKCFCPSSAVCWWFVDRMILARPILVYGLRLTGRWHSDRLGRQGHDCAVSGLPSDVWRNSRNPRGWCIHGWHAPPVVVCHRQYRQTHMQMRLKPEF
jgi:hypothetical protein